MKLEMFIFIITCVTFCIGFAVGSFVTYKTMSKTIKREQP
jgi:uncharacterized protein YneF (UPF0154 family)